MSSRRSNERQRGVTVVELMVALAVAAVLIGMALPAFNGFLNQRTLTTQANDFVLAVMLARSEATRRGEEVSVRAVDASTDTNEWGPGWCVVVGANPADCGGALRRFEALGDETTLDAQGAFDTLDTLTFNERGVLDPGANGTFALCHDNETDGRTLSLSLVGRTSVEEDVCP